MFPDISWSTHIFLKQVPSKISRVELDLIFLYVQFLADWPACVEYEVCV